MNGLLFVPVILAAVFYAGWWCARRHCQCPTCSRDRQFADGFDFETLKTER